MKHSILFITNGNFFANKILSKTLDQFSTEICGVVIVNGDYKGRSGIKAVYELSKVTALPYIIYKLFIYITFKIIQVIFPSISFSVESSANKKDIPTIQTVSIKDPNAIEWIKEKQPDLIVSVSCPQMIGKRILEIPKLGGINIHSSLLPKFAGIAPYYWVLSKGEKETGITVHYMTLKFDQGNILAQGKRGIKEHDNAFAVFSDLSQIGSSVLYEGIEKALNNDAGLQQDLSQYTYCSNPDNQSYKMLRKNGHRLINLRDFFTVIRSELSTTSQMKDSR